jgi:integrase
VAYGAGLRASEVIGLKVSDVDSKRHVLRIEQGKGRRDRYALLPPILLTRLRGWWRHARAEGKVLPDGWLFPGLDPMQSMSTRQLNRAVHEAAMAAHIDKRISLHTLRHCFATLVHGSCSMSQTNLAMVERFSGESRQKNASGGATYLVTRIWRMRLQLHLVMDPLPLLFDGGRRTC